MFCYAATWACYCDWKCETFKKKQTQTQTHTHTRTQAQTKIVKKTTTSARQHQQYEEEKKEEEEGPKPLAAVFVDGVVPLRNGPFPNATVCNSCECVFILTVCLKSF